MKTALVIGASRGIGRQICLTLGSHGYNVTVAAKSVEETDKRPGTIYTVSEEVEQYGVTALPFKCDARSVNDINNSVKASIASFGRLDFAIYNAGAILWRSVAKTPLKNFDLMHEVNTRGAYAMVQAVLPHFLEQKSGRILLIAPPIYSRFFNGKTPYSMTKVAASVLVYGLANELKGTGVSISALWPAVATESHVTKVNHIEPSVMRNARLFADACFVIGEEPTERYNGCTLLDEDMLRERGVSDFRPYRCDPEHEPPRMMPRHLPCLRVAEEDESAQPDFKSNL